MYVYVSVSLSVFIMAALGREQTRIQHRSRSPSPWIVAAGTPSLRTCSHAYTPLQSAIVQTMHVEYFHPTQEFSQHPRRRQIFLHDTAHVSPPTHYIPLFILGRHRGKNHSESRFEVLFSHHQFANLVSRRLQISGVFMISSMTHAPIT